LVFYDMNETISFVLWLIGALIQLFLTLFLLTDLMWKQTLKIEQFNPVWFIPIVGNIVVPLAGVYHVGVEINIFYFSLGIIFCITLKYSANQMLLHLFYTGLLFI